MATLAGVYTPAPHHARKSRMVVNQGGLGGSLDESWRAAPSVCATVLPGRRKDAALFSNRDKPVPRPSLPTLLACDGGRLSVLWRPLPGEASLRWLRAVAEVTIA